MTWLKRPMRDEDRGGIRFLWLESLWRQRHVRSDSANYDQEKCRHWEERRDVVDWLIARTFVEVLCDPEKQDIIWAFASTTTPVKFVETNRERGGAIHMVVVKKRFQEDRELRTAMLQDLLLHAKGYVQSEQIHLIIGGNWPLDRYYIPRMMLEDK